MTGKFLRRGAIISTVKSEERMNAQQKRNGRTRHPVRVVSCGCPDENCGAFHVLVTDRILPTESEAVLTLKAEKKIRKSAESKKKN